jgi:predicted dehydrogenase
MDKIKVGVIGIGFIGAAHVEALRRLPGIEVAAIAHSSDEKAKAKGEELGVERTYGDHRKLLEIKEIDAVHICTPNHLHYPQTRDALAAGKHVLCEKPLAVTVEEARDLVKLADSSGQVTAVHFNIRFYPLMSHIRAMIAAGELGEIYSIHGSYLQDWLFYDTDYNWRLEPEYSGESRAIADIGSHWMDLIEFVTGNRIEEVCADFATVQETPQAFGDLCRKAAETGGLQGDPHRHGGLRHGDAALQQRRPGGVYGQPDLGWAEEPGLLRDRRLEEIRGLGIRATEPDVDRPAGWTQ